MQRSEGSPLAGDREPDRGGGAWPSVEPAQDKFQAMMLATARPDLRLVNFQPRSMLVTAEHGVPRAKFPAIDYHNHLDSQDPAEVLQIMDSCGIERAVNITMRTGPDAFEVMERFHRAAPARFATIAWMNGPAFIPRTSSGRPSAGWSGSWSAAASA
jgi:hypothetical protein